MHLQVYAITDVHLRRRRNTRPAAGPSAEEGRETESGTDALGKLRAGSENNGPSTKRTALSLPAPAAALGA